MWWLPDAIVCCRVRRCHGCICCAGTSLDDALANYELALDLCKATGMAVAEVTVTCSIGLTYERQREPEAAL